ncbi:MAG: c-type cytochrome [Rhodospirillales bacterium]|nr:c-type cytochrome [Rhodospirillales bacterium]
MNIRPILAFGLILSFAMANGSAFAAGNAKKGAKVYKKKCKVCHVVKSGKKPTIGPNLFGSLGRKAGTSANYKKFKGLKGADWSWDAATLDEYLANPKKFLKKRNKPKSAMVLKLKKKKDRDNVIAYLATLK